MTTALGVYPADWWSANKTLMCILPGFRQSYFTNCCETTIFKLAFACANCQRNDGIESNKFQALLFSGAQRCACRNYQVGYYELYNCTASLTSCSRHNNIHFSSLHSLTSALFYMHGTRTRVCCEVTKLY